MTIPDVELQFPNSVLVFSRSRFSVCEVSGHPRETISPYESDSERGNKTAASERRKEEGGRERLKHQYITNTNTERTAPKGILVRERGSQVSCASHFFLIWACNFELTIMHHP